MDSFDSLLAFLKAQCHIKSFDDCSSYLIPELEGLVNRTDAFTIKNLEDGAQFGSTYLIRADFPNIQNFHSLMTCTRIFQLVFGNWSASNTSVQNISYFSDACVLRHLFVSDRVRQWTAMYGIVLVGGEEYQNLVNRKTRKIPLPALQEFSELLAQKLLSDESNFSTSSEGKIDIRRLISDA